MGQCLAVTPKKAIPTKTDPKLPREFYLREDLWSLEGVVSGERLDDKLWADFVLFSCVREMQPAEAKCFDVKDRLKSLVEKLD